MLNPIHYKNLVTLLLGKVEFSVTPLSPINFCCPVFSLNIILKHNIASLHSCLLIVDQI